MRKRDLVVAAALAGVAIAARAPFRSSSPPLHDAAGYLRDVRRLRETGRLKPYTFSYFKPLYLASAAGLAEAGQRFGGPRDEEFWAIALSLVSGGLAVAAAYAVARSLALGPGAAAAAAVLFGASPVVAIVSVEVLSEGPWTACALAAVAVLARAWERGSPGALGIGAFGIGAAFLFRSQATLLLPLLAFVAAAVAWKRRRPAAALPALAALLPTALYLALEKAFWHREVPLRRYALADVAPTIRLADLLDPERYAPVLARLEEAVTAPLLVVGLAGFVALALQARRGDPRSARTFALAAFLVVPTAAFFVVYLAVLGRHFTLVAFGFALGSSFFLECLGRGVGRPTGAVLFGSTVLLAGFETAKALPVLQVLRDRVHVNKAKAVWFGERATERDSFLALGSEEPYLEFYGGKGRVATPLGLAGAGVFEGEVEDPYAPEILARALRAASVAIEPNLRQGWRLFVSPERARARLTLDVLRERFEVVPVAVLEARRLRNQDDIDTRAFDAALLSRARDETIYEVRPRGD